MSCPGKGGERLARSRGPEHNSNAAFRRDRKALDQPQRRRSGRRHPIVLESPRERPGPMTAWLVPGVALGGALIEACTVPCAFAAPRLLRPVVSGGVALLLGLVFLMLSGRPWSSAIAAFALMAAVVAVSNAKFRAIREPLVFVDFAMLGQILRHPHIFITLVGVLAALAATAALAAAITAAILLEAPLPALSPAGARLAGMLVAVL